MIVKILKDLEIFKQKDFQIDEDYFG